MGKDEIQLISAKRAFKNAKEEGNREEEARWANLIGDILKKRGEYVEALRWLRIDYDISTKFLPQKHLLPTCQSIGELHLSLLDFSNALLFQKKHLQLAKDAKDVVEQQRASTQLGRTYYDMFLRSEDDHNSIRNAMKYFKSAMKLAQDLRESPPTSQSSFIKEYIDAHNNIGMIENDLDKPEEAIKILNKGLKICDEEEIGENDDSRTRLHHNLGIVYMDLRMWDKAREHIEKDIIICKNIGHCQGEAKGYINLGELHYRAKKYEEAIRCYKKALELADSMEDETDMIAQIDQNIEIVREAMKVMDNLKNEEQKLKKLSRTMVNARGTPHERKCLLKQSTLLDSLMEKCNTIAAWQKHCEFAKRKKKIAIELCDKEKLSDSFLLIGESYQKLRKFNKAKKWYTRSWEASKSIGNLEGQALAKINMGNVLDSDGDWLGALNAFQEANRIAVEANLPSIQLSALENMHYCHMIRFDNVEEARRLKLEIENLKQSKINDLEQKHVSNDCCPETDTEEDDCLSDSRSTEFRSKEISEGNSNLTKSIDGCDQLNDDTPLISLLQSCKHSVKKKTSNEKQHKSSAKPTEAFPERLYEETKTLVGRKRVRVVLSDDETEMQDEVDGSKDRFQGVSLIDVASSDESNRKKNRVGSACKSQDVSSKCGTNSCNPANIEESTCSYKSTNHNSVNPAGKAFRCSDGDEAVETFDIDASGSKCEHGVSEGLVPIQNATNIKFLNPGGEKKRCITFKIDNDLIHVEASLYEAIDKFNIDSLKVELACLYYLQLSSEKTSKGLLPILQDMRCAGRVLDSLEAFETRKDDLGNIIVEVSIEGWVQKRLMKLYIESCKELSEIPSMKLLQKLYISEVEDEVIASECELQDISITPLLNALLTNRTVAMLDLSHNLLGNGTMEKLQQFFTSAQRYGDLTLDLHCNRFGPTALFQICECPVLFTRLVVLNVSGNRLTDGCGSYLSTILTSCKALYSLNIERCSITSRTIQKVADALNENSNLSQLSIGYNNPISGNAIVNLMCKLAVLESFGELDLNGLKLNKSAVDSICQLAKMKCLSRLMLGSTAVGTDAALLLTDALLSSSQDSVKLDMSYCGLTARYLQITNSNMISGIVELNLGGNSFLQEGSNALASLLVNPQCCVRVLIVNKCQLGIGGVLRIINALAGNLCLQELHIADNISLENKETIPYYEPTERERVDILLPNPNRSESSSKLSTAKEAFSDKEGPCALNTDCDLEVADSEEMREATPLELDDSCTSSCQKNSSFNCQFIQEISTAIGMAKQLEFLDLSSNGFTKEIVDAFYATWSSRSRVESSWRHVKDQTIHFSLETNKCCRVRPCCKKD